MKILRGLLTLALAVYLCSATIGCGKSNGPRRSAGSRRGRAARTSPRAVGTAAASDELVARNR